MNVLLEALPEEWNGYIINTDFRVGIRISLALEDPDLFEEERWQIIALLLFQSEDGAMRECPQDPAEFTELLTWFLSGWNMDGKPRRPLVEPSCAAVIIFTGHRDPEEEAGAEGIRRRAESDCRGAPDLRP